MIHHLVTGGMENTLVNLINHTPPQRYRHAVLCIEDFSDFRQRIVRPEVEVVALHRSRIGAPAVRRAIHRWCRERRPAIVHSRNQSGLDALVPAWLAGVPVRVHGEHGWDVDNLDGRRWKPALLRRLHRPLVSAYVTVSRDLARFLRERIGVPPGRIHTITNGVDTTRFRPREAGEPPDPAGGGVLPPGFRAPGRLLVGTVGRIQPVKDQATLVRAAARLLAAEPELRERLRLAIVGAGPLLPALHAQVAAAGLDDVAWLPGASDRVPEVMRALDVFALPSLNEGISNTILEAMASGLPVLASHVGGNPELVDDGVTGALFAAGDDAALAARIRRYLDEPSMHRGQADAARAAALQRFSLPAMVERYLGLYDRLLSRPAG